MFSLKLLIVKKMDMVKRIKVKLEPRPVETILNEKVKEGGIIPFRGYRGSYHNHDHNHSHYHYQLNVGKSFWLNLYFNIFTTFRPPLFMRSEFSIFSSLFWVPSPDYSSVALGRNAEENREVYFLCTHSR